MEPSFAGLKGEPVRDEGYRPREDAGASVFDHAEAFSNGQRRHSALSYVSPAEGEQPG